ncbi:MAG TPA: hypothetical protein VGF49_24215, partial [Candidatus Solibacter sp.]
MPRRNFLCILSLAIAACHRAPAPMPDMFPETVGAWHRTSLRELKPAEAPDPVPQAGIEKIRAATYEGPGKLDVRVYQMSTAAVALDVVQSWRPAPDTIFFYADRFFVVVHWQSAERKALQDFV